MPSLGNLVAQVGLDIAQFTGALGKLENQIAGFERKASKSFNDLKGNVMGLAAGYLSVSAASAVFTNAANQAAALDDLADAFDLTIGGADQLALEMKLAGQDVQSLYKSLGELSKTLIEANDPTSKQAQVLKDLGVEVVKTKDGQVDLEKTYRNTLKQLAAIEDPALRSAVAQATLGKSGKELNKILQDQDEIAAMAAQHLALFGTTTEEQAKQAEDFGRQMVLMQDGLTRVALPIVEAVVPAIASLVRAFSAGGAEGKSLAETLGGALATSIRFVGAIVITVTTEMQKLGVALGGIWAIGDKVAAQDWKGARAVYNEVQADLKRIGDGANLAREELWKVPPPVVAIAGAANKVNEAGLGKTMADGGKGAAKLAADAEKAKKELQKLVDTYTDFAAARAASESPEYIKHLQAANKLAAEGKGNTIAYYEAMAKVYEASKPYADEQKKVAAALDRAADAVKRVTDEQKKQSDAVAAALVDSRASVDALKKEAAQLHMTADERRLDNIERERARRLAMPGVTAADRAIINRNAEEELAHQRTISLHNKEAAMQATWDAQDQARWDARAAKQTAIFDDLISIGTSAFNALITGSEEAGNAFKQLGDDLQKYVLSQLMQNQIKPLIGNMMTGIQNAFGAGGGGMSGIAGSIAGLFSNGGQGLSSLMGVAGGGAGAMVAGAGWGALVGALASPFVSERRQSGMQTGAMAGAAIGTAILPGIGTLIGAAAGALFGSLFKSSSGIPKTGGSAGRAINLATGGEWALDQRMFTPSTNDPQVRKLVESVTSSYAKFAEHFGVESGQAEFLLGYDAHPEYGSRVSSIARVGGQDVYSTKDVGVEGDIGEALEREASRLLLEALQGTTTGAAQAILATGTVDAALSDTETIQGIIDLAGSFYTLQKSIEALADPLATAQGAYEVAGRSQLEALNAQRDALIEMYVNAEPTVESLNELSTATGELGAATVDLMIGILAAKDAMAAMFEDTRDAIRLAMIPEEGRYDYHLNEAQRLEALLAAATDPAQIAALAEQINEHVNAAFGLLSPEEQQVLGADFLAGIDKAEDLAQERMDAAQLALKEQSERDHATFTTALESILATITGAATSFSTGADSVSVAAHVAADALILAAHTPVRVLNQTSDITGG